jgi:hypothetical protein
MQQPISLRRTLETLLDRGLARRYLRTSSSEVLPARHYYNAALRDLSIKDTEGAIHHLILSLDIEPDHVPSLHLSRTMLFGLSKKFHDEQGDFYKQKYPQLPVWVSQLEKKIQAVEAEILQVRNSRDTGNALSQWVAKLLKRRQPTRQERLDALVKQREDCKRQLRFATKLSQMEEYARVLSQMLEICMFPGRYAWIGDGDQATEGKEQKWYA